ncbi:SIS domain-containing protein [Liquorilactobacillus vini]|uniref:MurR/RpiR family transcriptional regulator n=1 Tax=Liquorilactobacillus vini TaxID=238015 RepID=UPI0002D77DFC
MAITSAISETALAQTLNLTDQDVLLVISNSGESKQILKQEKIAKQRGLTIIAITNRNDSPISLAADFQLTTAVRPPLLQSTYYYSRLAAMTVIEALFLLMIAKQPARSAKIKRHEELIADTKI